MDAVASSEKTGRETQAILQWLTLDGGVASEIIGQGFPEIRNDPLLGTRMNLTHPDVVKLVHKRYLAAGADVIETNTYQATVSSFMEHLNLGRSEAEDSIKQAVTLAKEARDDFIADKSISSGRPTPLIAGSIGPYGASQHDMSEYHGSYVEQLTIEELCDFHRPMVKVLTEAGVDVLAFDTIPAQKEAEAITKLLESFPDACAWISFSCKDGIHTCHGETLVDAVRSIIQCDQLVGVGINCTSPIYISSLLRQISGTCQNKTVIVYPNSGDKWLDGERVEIADIPPIADCVSEWTSLGARCIGGCCQFIPDDIRSIKEAFVTARKKVEANTCS